MSPEVLKKTLDLFGSLNPTELKLTSASTGSVPRENTSIVNAPEKNEPVESARTCIDCVKPQGKKNVATPTSSGVRE